MEIKRIQRLSDMVGQNKIRESLDILVTAARQRGEILDHLLFIGSAGLGKTTFANIVANEMRVNIKIVTDSAIQKVTDLTTVLTSLHAGDILLIEQIESMRKPAVELLIPSVEDFSLDVIIGKGVLARGMKLKLPRFTLIGTASELSHVDQRLRQLMTVYQFLPYNLHELAEIILLTAKQRGIVIDSDSVNLIAQHGNGIPSRTLNLVDKVQKYAEVRTGGIITPVVVKNAVAIFGFENILP